MTPDSIFSEILGPLGALVIACVALVFLYRLLLAERARNDRLDAITEGALTNTASMLERTESVLANHERLFIENQRIFAALEAIRAEQAHAKDREDWKR